MHAGPHIETKTGVSPPRISRRKIKMRGLRQRRHREMLSPFFFFFFFNSRIVPFIHSTWLGPFLYVCVQARAGRQTNPIYTSPMDVGCVALRLRSFRFGCFGLSLFNGEPNPGGTA